MKKTFAKKLKEARMAVGMTQVELADAMGVSEGTIGNYEMGIRVPDANAISRITTALGVTASYLLGDIMDIESEYHSVALNDDEVELIKAYRSATPVQRANAMACLAPWEKLP